MGTILDWSSNYPASIDDTVTNFPTLTNNVHDVRASHVNALRNAVIEIESIQDGLVTDVIALQTDVTTLQTTVANNTNFFVYDSGASPSGNIYANATLLMNAIEAVDGPTVVEVRSNLTIAGTFNVQNVHWIGYRLLGDYPLITFDTTANISFYRMKFENCKIKWNNATDAVLNITNSGLLKFDNSTIDATNGGGWLWKVANNQVGVISIYNANFSNNITSPFGNVGTGANAHVFVDGYSTLQTAAFSGAGNVSVYLLSAGATTPATMAGVSGTYTVTRRERADGILVDPAVTGIADTILQDVLEDLASRLQTVEGVASAGNAIIWEWNGTNTSQFGAVSGAGFVSPSLSVITDPATGTSGLTFSATSAGVGAFAAYEITTDVDIQNCTISFVGGTAPTAGTDEVGGGISFAGDNIVGTAFVFFIGSDSGVSNSSLYLSQPAAPGPLASSPTVGGYGWVDIRLAGRAKVAGKIPNLEIFATVRDFTTSFSTVTNCSYLNAIAALDTANWQSSTSNKIGLVFNSPNGSVNPISFSFVSIRVTKS